MQVNWKKFQTAYQQASINTKQIINSNMVVSCVDTIYLEHSIPTESRNEFILMYTYMILGITNEKEVLNFLNIKVKPEAGADKVFSSLLICLAKETNNSVINTKEDPENSDTPWESKQSDSSDTNKLRTIRTMENDSGEKWGV